MYTVNYNKYTLKYPYKLIQKVSRFNVKEIDTDSSSNKYIKYLISDINKNYKQIQKDKLDLLITKTIENKNCIRKSYNTKKMILPNIYKTKIIKHIVNQSVNYFPDKYKVFNDKAIDINQTNKKNVFIPKNRMYYYKKFNIKK